MRDAGWMQYIKSSTGASLVFTHLTLACLNLSHITLSNLSYIACLPSLVCLPLFLHFDSCSDSSIESLLDRNSTPRAKKITAVTPPAQGRHGDCTTTALLTHHYSTLDSHTWRSLMSVYTNSTT